MTTPAPARGTTASVVTCALLTAIAVAGVWLCWRDYLGLKALGAQVVRDHEHLTKLVAARPAPVPADPAPAPRTQESVTQRPDLQLPTLKLGEKEAGLVRQAQLRQMETTYAALFRQLAAAGMSAGQLDQLKAVLVARLEAAEVATAAPRKYGISEESDPERLHAIVAQAESGFDAQIASAAGPAFSAQYDRFETTLPQRQTAEQVAGLLRGTGSALSDAQVEGLVTLLATESSSEEPPDSTTFRSSAATLLTPPQLQALADIQQRNAALEKARAILHGE